MLGVKLEHLNLKNKYTIEEFYKQIRYADFDAGVPELVNCGTSKIIVFPQINRNNQVQILADSEDSFAVIRSTQPVGPAKIAGNMILEGITGGLSGISMLCGKHKKRCMELVTITADQIRELDL